MIARGVREFSGLLDLVKALENKDSQARGEQVIWMLSTLGIESSFQQRHHPHIKNIVVDFVPSSGNKKPVFSAHYDVVKGSPGANDDASGVAVLLKLCEHLKQHPLPARIVFFDREEAWIRTPVLKLGLLGSMYYVFGNDLSNVSAVFNLEFCGAGECVAIWPVKSRERDFPAIKAVETAASRLELPHKAAHVPWFILSSDHLSFRMRGVSNALTLSLVPLAQLPAFERWVSGLSIPALITGRRPVPPQALSRIHTAADTASELSEQSLGLMLSLLIEVLSQQSQLGLA